MSTSPSPDSSVSSSRLPTLRIADLLTTKVQSVRIELMGNHSSTVMRLGTVLVYLPLLIIGYLLLLASVMRLAAVALGWGVTILLFGALHLAISAWGMTRGRLVGAAERHDVLDPAVAPQETPTKQGPSDIRPDIRPFLPPPFSLTGAASAIGAPALRNTSTNFLGSAPIGSAAEVNRCFESGGSGGAFEHIPSR